MSGISGRAKARPIRLSIEVDEKLEDLCTHYGVTCNSYLLNAIGKAIAADYTAVQQQQLMLQHANSGQQVLLELFEKMTARIDEQEKDE